MAAEMHVCETLLRKGFRDVKRFRPDAPWDLEVDGKAVEIKMRSPEKDRKRGLRWYFTLRQGIWREKKKIWSYVLCLRDVPGHTGFVCMVLRGRNAPDRLTVTPESLQGILRRHIDNWKIIQAVPYTLKPRKEISHLIPPRLGWPQSARPRGWYLEELAAQARSGKYGRLAKTWHPNHNH